MNFNLPSKINIFKNLQLYLPVAIPLLALSFLSIYAAMHIALYNIYTMAQYYSLYIHKSEHENDKLLVPYG